MVTSPGKACRPRRYGGTRSPRYAARRAERGTVVAYAPSWSDAGATTVLEALHTRCSGPGEITAVTKELLTGSSAQLRAFAQSLPLSQFDKQHALEILEINAERCAGKGEAEAKKQARAFLKPLRARRAAHGEMKALELPKAELCGRTLLGWLSQRPEGDRLRAS